MPVGLDRSSRRGRRRPRPRPASAPAGQGPRRRARRLEDERRAAGARPRLPGAARVPGWVGIASIKWLGALQVTTTRVDSPWNTRWYRMHGAGWDDSNATLDRMPVKSTVDVAAPLEAGRISVLRGRAWSGGATVAVVEVSTDGGRTWQEATLTGPNEPSSWVAWEHAWTPGTAGVHEVADPRHRQPRPHPARCRHPQRPGLPLRRRGAGAGAGRRPVARVMRSGVNKRRVAACSSASTSDGSACLASTSDGSAVHHRPAKRSVSSPSSGAHAGRAPRCGAAGPGGAAGRRRPAGRRAGPRAPRRDRAPRPEARQCAARCGRPAAGRLRDRPRARRHRGDRHRLRRRHGRLPRAGAGARRVGRARGRRLRPRPGAPRVTDRAAGVPRRWWSRRPRGCTGHPVSRPACRSPWTPRCGR